MAINKNYQFYLEMDAKDYIGEWVAICDEKVVSHGKDVQEVLKQAKKKCPKARPFMTRIPDKETMIFYHDSYI